MNWTPLFDEIIESSVWELPDHVRLAWIAILAKKDWRTQEIRMNSHRLSKWAKISEDKATDAIDVLSSPDPLTLSQEHEGRRILRVDDSTWKVVNGEVYKQRIKEIRNREETRRRMAERRKTEAGEPDETYSPESRVLLHYLNEKTNGSFRESSSSLEPINARLKEPGVDVEGCKRMIDRQASKWLKDEKMRDYLRPSTLFNKTKFNEYYAMKDVSAPIKDEPIGYINGRKIFQP